MFFLLVHREKLEKKGEIEAYLRKIGAYLRGLENTEGRSKIKSMRKILDKIQSKVNQGILTPYMEELLKNLLNVVQEIGKIVKAKNRGKITLQQYRARCMQLKKYIDEVNNQLLDAFKVHREKPDNELYPYTGKYFIYRLSTRQLRLLKEGREPIYGEEVKLDDSDDKKHEIEGYLYTIRTHLHGIENTRDREIENIIKSMYEILNKIRSKTNQGILTPYTEGLLKNLLNVTKEGIEKIVEAQNRGEITDLRYRTLCERFKEYIEWVNGSLLEAFEKFYDQIKAIGGDKEKIGKLIRIIFEEENYTFDRDYDILQSLNNGKYSALVKRNLGYSHIVARARVPEIVRYWSADPIRTKLMKGYPELLYICELVYPADILIYPIIYEGKVLGVCGVDIDAYEPLARQEISPTIDRHSHRLFTAIVEEVRKKAIGEFIPPAEVRAQVAVYMPEDSPVIDSIIENIESVQTNEILKVLARNLSHHLGCRVTQSIEMEFDENEGNIVIPRDYLEYLRRRKEFLAYVPLGTFGSGKIYWDKLRNLFSEEVGKRLAHNKRVSLYFEPHDSNLMVKLPYGVAVGSQALFIIVENYIANLARYGEIETTQSPEFEVKAEPSPEAETLVEVTLSSNAKFTKDESKIGEEKAKVERLVKSPKIKSYGITEMKIGAAILRGKAGWRYNEKMVPQLLEVKVCEKQNKISYTFYLLKVKEFKKVTSNNDLKKLIESNEASVYDFLVIPDSEENRNIVIENVHKVPTRIVFTVQDKVAAKNEITLNSEQKWFVFMKEDEFQNIPENEKYYRLQQTWLKSLLKSENIKRINNNIEDPQNTLLRQRKNEIKQLIDASNKEIENWGMSPSTTEITLSHKEEAPSEEDEFPFTQDGPLVTVFVERIKRDSERTKDAVLDFLTVLYLRIGIVDDRIYQLIRNSEVYKHIRIYVYPENENGLEELAKLEHNLHFLIIHRGFIDKLKKSFPKDKWSTLREKIPYIVVDTARPTEDCYKIDETKLKVIPFSNLEYCFRPPRYFGKKYALVNLLLS